MNASYCWCDIEEIFIINIVIYIFIKLIKYFAGLPQMLTLPDFTE